MAWRPLCLLPPEAARESVAAPGWTGRLDRPDVLSTGLLKDHLELMREITLEQQLHLT